MTTRGGPPDELAEVVRALRATVGESSFPLPVPSAGPAGEAAAQLLTRVDDYLLPRLARRDAPLLVGVGGPTGAGKSTTVNSLIRAPASVAGVLRPTTRSPVLVCHPSDSAWFRAGPWLGDGAHPDQAEPGQVRLVTAPAMPVGCAFLDTPDIDSVVTANREVATRLLATTDLWLFVTTAARYADAVPWELLHTAQQRGTTVALLLNRVPTDVVDEITGQVQELLSAHGLDRAPMFVAPETRVDGQGMLPETAVAPLRTWFDELAADDSARAEVVSGTLDGALAALPATVEQLAAAAEEQLTAADSLAEQVGVAYGTARATVERGVSDGALLRGEALTRWREFVDTGEWKRARLAPDGRPRPRLPTGRSRAGRDLVAAIQAGLVSLVRSAVVDADEHTHGAWEADPAGASLLTTQPPAPTLADADDQAARLANEWRREVFALVETEMAGARGRGAAYAAYATGTLVLVATVTSAAEVGKATAAGESGTAEQVLAAAHADHSIRALATKAREDLLERVGALLETEAARYLDRLAGASPEAVPAGRLRELGAALERARLAAVPAEGPAGQAAPGPGPEQ